MCGIAGIIHLDGRPVDREMLKRMTNTMRHRGPDDEGYYFDHHVGLGHRRLSIIDLSDKGHQPMANEDGSVWITFNGEIYNYRELSQSLKHRGHIFRSRCDTETIIHLYEEYGKDCVDHLRGMFAFGIWDARNKRFFAAVDRLRIKPLYYTIVDHTFLFASELKALLASYLIQPTLNYEAIHHYLSLQAIPVPMTIYENIYTLPGGYALELENGELKVYSYWDIQYPEGEIRDEAYYKKKVRELVWESVEMRMMSDVPLGAFLSGGIDSSAIVAIMSQVSDSPIRTFSIGYDVGGKDYDDTYYAKLVSRKYNTEHTVRVVSKSDIVEQLPDFLYYLDQPSSDAINSFFVSQLAAKDVTVVLCGQGGDELFAGYPSFYLLKKFFARDEKWEKLPPPIRALIASSLRHAPGPLGKAALVKKMQTFLDEYGSFLKKYARIRMELTEAEKQSLYSSYFREKLNGADTFSIYNRYLQQVNPAADYLKKVAYLDLKTHLGDILMRDVDVMSMAFSLETRVPLIDHKLVEFASTIPSELKLNGTSTKYIFIESIKDLLPEEVIRRKKLGFNFPFAIWLKNGLSGLVDFVLSRDHIEARNFFEYDQVERLKHVFRTQDVNYRKIWGLVVLELWIRMVHENDRSFIEKAQSAAMSTFQKTSA